MRLIKTFRNTPRKRRDSTRTGMMKSGQHGTQRDRSCETAARHNHVHVRLVGHRRAPCARRSGVPAPRRAETRASAPERARD